MKERSAGDDPLEHSRSEGAVWAAFGLNFLFMAAHSARTLAANTPAAGRFILTNLPIKSVRWKGQPVFTGIRKVDSPDADNRLWKLTAPSWTPFDKTVYLDCDIEVRADISPLFKLLDFWPLFARHNTTRTLFTIPIGDTDSQWLAISEWNGGVFGFDRRREEIPEFFKVWYEDYVARGESRDQSAFLRTIYNPDTIIPLPINGSWNAMNKRSEQGRFFTERPEDIRIFHYIDPSRSPDIRKSLSETLRHLEVESREDGEKIRDSINEILVKTSKGDGPVFKEPKSKNRRKGPIGGRGNRFHY